jgi:hypothetical protein
VLIGIPSVWQFKQRMIFRARRLDDNSKAFSNYIGEDFLEINHVNVFQNQFAFF